MNPQEVVDIVKSLRSINWRWDLEGWRGIAAELGLTEVERSGQETAQRITCSPLHGHPLTVLASNGQVTGVEVTVDAFPDTDKLSGSAYEYKVNEFYDKHRAAVQAAEPILGQPKFNDGAAARGYPKDQNAEWLAWWPAENGRLMIQERHEGRKLPFYLCVVVVPPAPGGKARKR